MHRHNMIFRGVDDIRAKLSRLRHPSPVFAGEAALITYEPTPQRFHGRCVAVTSCNPNPARWARQRKCLMSWLRIGLEVITVNTAAELQSMELPDGVTGFACDVPSSWYDRPVQRISSLLQAGAASQLPTLILNSDIEIHGNGDLIASALSSPDRLTIGVRFNHETGERLSKATREPWGLDAFLLTPEMIRAIPDEEFAIGKPIWDYWIPHQLRSIGFNLGWIDAPFFYHESHPLAWNQKEWHLGAAHLASHYGLDLVYDSAAFRHGLNEHLEQQTA